MPSFLFYERERGSKTENESQPNIGLLLNGYVLWAMPISSRTDGDP